MHNTYKITFKTTEHIPERVKKYLTEDHLLVNSYERIVDKFEFKIWGIDQLTGKETYEIFLIPYKDVKEIK